MIILGNIACVSRRNSYLCIPITQECIAVILTKVSLVVLNNSFDVVIYFHYITITHYFSFEKGHRSSFEQKWNFIHPRTFNLVLIWFIKGVNSLYYVSYLYISSQKTDIILHLDTLEFQECFAANLVESGSVEKEKYMINLRRIQQRRDDDKSNDEQWTNFDQKI